MSNVQKLVGGAHFVRTAQAHVAVFKQLSGSLCIALFLQSFQSEPDSHAFEELTLWHWSISHDLFVFTSYLRNMVEVHVSREI